jgi:ribokinase
MKQARAARFDILTLGAATRDVFVKSRRFEQMPSVDAPDGLNACLPLGAKIPVDELVFETGGGATNAAVTFARFGLKTACVSRIGHDAGGTEIVSHLTQENVDTSGIETDKKERTGYSIILLAGSGHRTILVARGASSSLGKNMIAWNKLRAKWIYLTSLAGNMTLLKKTFSEAKRSLTHVSWNPGNAEIEHGLKALLPFLLQTDVLILNVEEASALADCAPRQLDCILKTLGPLPREALIVTDGVHGAYAHARGVTWHVASLKGKIINTTGAGDAFGSAFTASLMQDGNIETALKAATLNAFGVVNHMGAKVGILKQAPSKGQLARVRVRTVA